MRVSFFIIMMFGMIRFTHADCAREALSSMIQPRRTEIQRYHSREIPVQVPISGTLRLEKMLGEPVLLGVGKEGHFYLVVGKTRLEGAFQTSVRKLTQGKISPGYVFRFPDVPPEKIAAWQKKMAANPIDEGYRYSCAHAACAALQDGFGIRIAGSKGANIFGSPTFKKILLNGFTDEAGKKVEVEIFRTSARDPSLEQIADKLLEVDRSEQIPYFVAVGIPVGGVLIYILDSNHD